MRLYIKVKSIGSKKGFIDNKEIFLPIVPKILKDLIIEIIKINVDEYNKQITNKSIVQYLTKKDITNMGETIGKIGFNGRNRSNKQSLDSAIEVGILAFQDGLFRVFINDEEVENLNDNLDLKEDDVLCFIKFILLAGRLW